MLQTQSNWNGTEVFQYNFSWKIEILHIIYNLPFIFAFAKIFKLLVDRPKEF